MNTWLEPKAVFIAHLPKGKRWSARHGKKWYADNAEKRRAYMREYYRQHPERREYLLKKQREYRATAAALA